MRLRRYNKTSKVYNTRMAVDGEDDSVDNAVAEAERNMLGMSINEGAAPSHLGAGTGVRGVVIMPKGVGERYL